MTPDPRHIAFNVLLSWDKTSHTLDKSIEFHSNEISLLSKNDRNLCNALIFGVLRHRESIDWIISASSKIPLEKLDTKPLYLLRISLLRTKVFIGFFLNKKHFFLFKMLNCSTY